MVDAAGSTSLAEVEDRSSCENEPAHEGAAGQERRERMTKQDGGGGGACKSGEIGHDVVDGSHESMVDDMSDSYDDTAREGHRQEKADHSAVWPKRCLGQSVAGVFTDVAQRCAKK